MKKIFLMYAAFLSLPALSGNSQNAQYVQIGSIKTAVIPLGKTAEVAVPVVVAGGYHVQSNPASASQLIPTALELKSDPGFLVGAPNYPKGKPYHLPGSNNEISTYEGKFEVKVSLTASATAKVGPHRLVGKLKYQACNEKNCFFPTSSPVEIPVTVVAK
jgi:hypothetical protein